MLFYFLIEKTPNIIP